MKNSPAFNRARKKVEQISEELKKSPVCWHSVAHLSRDLAAVAQAERELKIKSPE
ncbi:MAG: hypothetical protein WCK17_10580 [Verrucomicrobiota bacterium]